MARYPLNQPVRVPTTVTQLNVDGTTTLVNAGTLTLTVAKPDGTQQNYSTPTNDGTGLYHQDLPAADLQQAGHYQYLWTATGTGAGVSFGDFDVFDPLAETAVLSLQDAKEHLNIPQATTTYDSELASWIASIQSNLEQFTGGPILNRSVTERVEATAGQTALCLRQRPLVSLTSVVSVGSGQAISITDFTDLDKNASIIRRALGWPMFGPFFQWLPIFNVTYTAGWGTSVPAAFNDFARIVIRHLWETQRGATPAPMQGGGETVMVPGFAFAIPNRAAELLNGSLNGVPFRIEAFV